MVSSKVSTSAATSHTEDAVLGLASEQGFISLMDSIDGKKKKFIIVPKPTKVKKLFRIIIIIKKISGKR